MNLITESNQHVQAVHSFNSWLYHKFGHKSCVNKGQCINIKLRKTKTTLSLVFFLNILPDRNMSAGNYTRTQFVILNTYTVTMISEMNEKARKTDDNLLV